MGSPFPLNTRSVSGGYATIDCWGAGLVVPSRVFRRMHLMSSSRCKPGEGKLCSVSEKRLTDVLLAALESVRGNQTAASSVGLVTDFRRVYSKAVALSKASADALIPHSE